MNEITFQINPTLKPDAICDLRESVGWDRQEQDYPAAQNGYWATVGGFDNTGTLMAWCAILSDSVRHAVLLDVIVHPSWQHQGIGRTLVAHAIQHIQAHNITIIHVDFLPEKAAFYEHCGFQIGLGGIYKG
ncbi:MAG: GNAT family N-acetyltransferase [Chloroflexota bacterium]|nr:GNAT family N-acetyltransferase [Chloroflexota bacterium]